MWRFPALISVSLWGALAGCSAQEAALNDLEGGEDGTRPDLFVEATSYSGTVQADSYTTYGTLDVVPGESVRVTARASDSGGIGQISLVCPDSDAMDALLSDGDEEEDRNPGEGDEEFPDSMVTAYASFTIPTDGTATDFEVVALAWDLAGTESLPVTIQFQVHSSEEVD